MEEGSHSGQLDKAKSNSMAYIEGNSNPRPKSGDQKCESLRPKRLAEQRPTTYKERKGGGSTQEIVTKEEVHEFLEMICHSEYEILDQLHKTQARVSLLSLLINLEGHRELLLKVFYEVHVPQDIIPKKFGGIINNISTSRHPSFSEDEVSVEGCSHNQPLHITVKCGNYMIPRVLIDNGSSLNIMPKATLDKLYCSGDTLKNSPVVVRAFDGSKREVMGKITLPIHIRPTTFGITFQVMDI
ncbi:hypothetical protein CR513_44244, partial [Mucuna pruriens]